LEARQALEYQPRPRLHEKKGKIERLKARALANPSWGFEYVDETWFVWVPPKGVMNPKEGYGWQRKGRPLKNAASRKKGQQTWSCYLSLEIEEARLARRYSQGTNSWETCCFVYERLVHHERLGHRVLVLAWDPASWHTSRDLMNWVRGHNRLVRELGRGVRIVPVTTPVHAFWLNPVEPLIGHAKRRVLPCRQFPDQTEQQAALDRHWLHRNLLHARAPKPEDFIAHLH
jgi:DDE superfamily endonuclease